MGELEEKEMANRLSNIETDIKWMVKKMDELCVWKDETSRTVNLFTFSNVNERLRSVENRLWYLSGGLALLAFMLLYYRT